MQFSTQNHKIAIAQKKVILQAIYRSGRPLPNTLFFHIKNVRLPNRPPDKYHLK